MWAWASYPGSAGELLQGNYKGRDVLLSCPINLYSHVKVFESKHPKYKYKRRKANTLLVNLLSLWGYSETENTLDIEICSEIPVGKGFASSTADLCALYNALLKLFNRNFNQQELIEECIGIEPTDSIIFSEMTLFDYKRGSFIERIGKYIEFNILVFEGSNEVDTVAFNQGYLPPMEKIDDLVSMLKDGVVEKNLNKIGYSSTESIVRNQHRLKYDYLEYIQKLNRKYQGSGIIGAHSGNCLGIMFEEEERATYVKNSCKAMSGYAPYVIKTVKCDVDK